MIDCQSEAQAVTGNTYICIGHVGHHKMTDFPVIDHVSSVACVSTKRAYFISSIEALPDILGGEVNSSLEPLEQRLRWPHWVVSR